MQKKKKGFTLVELSIVLVIIGLLIGGILAAQSMISTTKIQNFIRQVQQVDIAVSNFQTKFNGLPGDAIAFGGNGNGFIEDDSGPGCECFSFAGEISNFWVNLQQSGFNPTDNFKFSSVATGNLMTAPNINILPIALGKNTGMWAGHIDDTQDFPMRPLPQNNSYVVGLFTLQAGQITPVSLDEVSDSIDYSDALAIDTKIDDGDFGNGNVRGDGNDPGYLVINMLSQVGQ